MFTPLTPNHQFVNGVESFTGTTLGQVTGWYYPEIP